MPLLEHTDLKTNVEDKVALQRRKEAEYGTRNVPRESKNDDPPVGDDSGQLLVFHAHSKSVAASARSATFTERCAQEKTSAALFGDEGAAGPEIYE